MKITKDKILKKLSEVLDPELGISIVDMGLIYDIHLNLRGTDSSKPPRFEASPRKIRTSEVDNQLTITMTLTTIGCPLYPMIEQEIKNKLAELGLKDKDYKIKLTFDPPWSMERMSKKGKATLGI